MLDTRVAGTSLVLVLLLVVSDACGDTTTTPGSYEAFIFEPYAFVSEVYAGPEVDLSSQGYLVLRLTDSACDLDPEETTLTSFESG